ncbi:MAG: glycosyltransferase family 87 protein [Tepidisphaeraceae bacterium]|jgi:glycosyl transferase family 87
MRIIDVLKDRLTTRHDLRTRLWRVGGLVAVFLVTILIGNTFISKDRAITWDMLGHDFLPFYYGGTCARTGHYEQLFDLPAAKAFEFNTGHAAGLSLGTSFGPWWNPPFAAWMFAPLSALPYLSALHVWWTFSAVCLAASIFLMCRMLRGGWETQLLVPFLVLMAMPCFQAFCHGQNTFFSLMLLTTTVWLWRGNRSLLAGMVCGLLFYKPQLGAVIAAVLCLGQGRRAILGVCLTGTALVLVNVLTMPGTLHEFVYHVPLNLRWIQDENPYRWERHVTFKAFWRLVFQGDNVGPTTTATRVLWGFSEIAMLAALGAMVVKTMRSENSPSERDRLISATIAAMPLLMPFYFDYDLLLMSVGIVVYAADRQRGAAAKEAQNWEDRWLVRVWSVVFLALIFWKTRMNPVVPLLAAAAGMLIRRGLRTPAKSSAAELPRSLPTALAA